ncbi:MAG: hypothetical protein IKE64_10590, partial [Thermoguttaceae bacterium]|nr:hypothetical protein [Thermoguttaceae bacterium]
MKEAISQNGAVAAAFGDYVTFHEDPQLRELAEEAERNRKDIMDELQFREDRGILMGRIQDIKRILTKRFGSLPSAVTEALDKKVTRRASAADFDPLFDLAMDC